PRAARARPGGPPGGGVGPGRGPAAAAGGAAAAYRRPGRGGRAVAAQAQPRRGLLRPHRPPHRRRREERSRVTTITHPAAGTPAPVLQDRVGPLDAVRHTLTRACRGLVQIRHNPMELADLSLQPLMFVALFAYVFGGAISGSPKAFLQFGLAGIICQNALFLTMNTGVALNNDITKGVFAR